MRNVPLLQSNSLVHAAKAMNTAPVFTLKPGEDGLCRAYEAEVPPQVEPDDFERRGCTCRCRGQRQRLPQS